MITATLVSWRIITIINNNRWGRNGCDSSTGSNNSSRGENSPAKVSFFTAVAESSTEQEQHQVKQQRNKKWKHQHHHNNEFAVKALTV